MVRRVELDREVTLERAVREVVDDASRPMDGVVVTPGIAKLAAIAEPRCFFNPTNPGQPRCIVLVRGDWANVDGDYFGLSLADVANALEP